MTVRFAHIRTRLLDNLQRNAFGIYLLHIVFVAWIQYALLRPDWSALVKAPIVFSAALVLSWATSEALRRLPVMASIIGTVAPAPPAQSASIRPAVLLPH
jgi:surface polysaccharide O-acyltransferase-like enzyme